MTTREKILIFRPIHICKKTHALLSQGGQLKKKQVMDRVDDLLTQACFVRLTYQSLMLLALRKKWCTHSLFAALPF